MPEDEARYHMKRCIDSGMWVPDASDIEKSADDAKKADEEEDIYEDASSLPTAKEWMNTSYYYYIIFCDVNILIKLCISENF